MQARLAAIAGSLAIVVGVGRAHADSDDLVARPLVLARNEIAIDVTIEANLATGQLALPLSFAPDIWWGITSHLTVGVIDSAMSVDSLTPGSSFCVRSGDTLGLCKQLYHGSGLDARYSIYDDGTFAIAPRARVVIRDTDPWKPAATVGALARWHHGRFAIEADPYLQLGLDNNSLGNYSALDIPIYLELQPTCRWMIALQTGYQADLDVISDGYHIPVGILTTVRVLDSLDVGAEFGLASALGPQNDVKQRAMFLTVGWRSGS